MSPLMRLSACFVALMMAMGIGRFALTPQMPHLLSEGQFDLTAAGLIAAANYFGYLLGAVDAMFAQRPQQVQRRLHGGLWLCVLLTLASFWADGFWSHLALRFGTGVTSAWVLVMITSLSQPLAAAAGRPRLGALVFAGPGLGIFLTGVLALVSHLLHQTSATLWLIYAAAALVMMLGVWRILPQPAVASMVQLVMQRSREIAPHATQRNAGLLTACFALGQLSGPLLAALSSHFSGGLQPALVIAGSGLLIAGGLAIQSTSADPALSASACAATARR